MTRVRLLRAEDLTPDHVRAWSDLQRADPVVDSAFFRPELARLTAAARGDVEVGVLEDGGEPVGFFPFQRGPRNVAQPIVGRLSEFHGVVARAGLDWTPEQLVRGCRLVAWPFDHLPAAQAAFLPYRWGSSRSPYLDLSRGYAAYEAEKNASGSSVLRNTRRKARKMEREVGPLRFEWHTDSDDAFHALLAWKAAQYRRTGMLDVFAYDWVVKLMEGLRRTHGEHFSGPLSVLYAADRPVAVHLGLCTDRVFHVWKPAYDRDHERHSPGMILMLHLAEAAAARGIMRIDFGKGPERYKTDLESGAIPLAEGSVDLRPVTRRVRRTWDLAKRRIRSSPWRDQLELPLAASNRLRQWLAFR